MQFEAYCCKLWSTLEHAPGCLTERHVVLSRRHNLPAGTYEIPAFFSGNNFLTQTKYANARQPCLCAEEISENPFHKGFQAANT